MLTATDLFYPIAIIGGGLITLGLFYLLGSLFVAKIRFEANVKLLKGQVDSIALSLNDHIKTEDLHGPLLHDIVDSVEGLKLVIEKHVAIDKDSDV